MRYALIDNSTLTGIQRLLGEIPVRNRAIVDNDIISLENYIQAILFYDDIICIDDYIEKYRENRTKFFPNIHFISKDLFAYNSFVKKAIEVTADIVLRINGGRITDKDFKDYFEKLEMTFQFTWDMSSSSYFLTQKMLLGNSALNQEQFSKLHSLLYNEKNEQFEVQETLINKSPKLYDSKGNEIFIDNTNGKILNSHVGEGLSPQLNALVSSLNWMSQRTAFYVLAANYLYADLFLQPIRQNFLQNIIRRTHPSYDLGVFGDFRTSINNLSQETLNNILSNSSNFGLSVETPLFAAFFAKKTQDSKSIISAALNEREKTYFHQARTKLRELNVLLDNNERSKFVRDINLLTTEINKTFKNIERKYGLGEKQGIGLSQLKFLYSSIPLLREFTIPEGLDIRIKELEFMKHLLPKKGFNAVYRNVIGDLLQFEKLGQYRDILINNVVYHKDATFWGVRTEDPKFARATSSWKKPM
ncbi:hypothetical protein H7F15_16560 [Pontibacter sp. Tf4]|uniref:hypothetical protein n=1 Tax=Pontibacter sp. Tf4 TaxID=2761620 RepID=UPI00162A5A6D|nr:hypothetical protein [Pontibacter sp. Tf4]MBB6612656.1 hypothetical protein [Pontibacter sp. Tf4]